MLATTYNGPSRGNMSEFSPVNLPSSPYNISDHHQSNQKPKNNDLEIGKNRKRAKKLSSSIMPKSMM